MTVTTALVTVLSAGAAALLLYAGIAKFVQPAPLATAIGELLRYGAAPLSMIRLLAAVEMALALLIAVASEVAGVRLAATALGVAFILVGVVGRIRSAKQPCGCFGISSRRALGLANVLVGIALVAWAGIAGSGPPAAPPAAETLLLALNIAAAAVCVRNRRYVALLFNATAHSRRAS